MKDKQWPAMPYPGLRPFDVSADRDESDIYFGRKAQIYELIDRLAESHLIAVLGPSGCGKSSLIRAGLIPYLEKGYLDRAGARWEAVKMEPGGHPVRALATVLHEAAVRNAPDRSALDPFATEALEKRLNRRPDALVELFEETETSTIFGRDRNILILVDQFEELFREDMTSEPDALHFINLMLNVYHDPPQRLYIVLTMRTDFIKNSACYPGLPTVLSRTMYLIDKIDKMGLREAITEPVKLESYRGEISKDLTRWILKEMVTDGPYDPDLLPLMQHALLRGWQKASQEDRIGAEEKKVLRLEDYADFANLADCLSKHADAIFNELKPEQQRIAEVMFRLLCDVTPDGSEVRRVTSPEEIAAVSGCKNLEEVRTVIKAFTADGAGFIRWKDEGKKLDVSHESFIRKWEKFRDWAKDEAEKGRAYQRLEERAQVWREGKASLLYSLDLYNVLAWEKRTNPSKEWAQRYGKSFDIAMKFLKKSKNRRKVRSIMFASAFAIVLSILVIGFLTFANLKVKNLGDDGFHLLTKATRISDVAERDEMDIEVDPLDAAEDSFRRAIFWDIFPKVELWHYYALYFPEKITLSKSPDIHNGLGQVYERKGRFDDARKEFKTATDEARKEKHRNLPNYLLNFAEFSLSQEDYDEVVTNAEEVISHSKRLAHKGRAYILKGNALARQDRLKDAAKSYEDARNIYKPKEPKDLADWYLELANSSLTVSKFEEAIKDCNSLIKERKLKPLLQQLDNSRKARVYFIMGVAYFGQEDHNKAMQSYEEAVNLDPRNPQAHQSLGEIYERLGRLNEAEESFKDAIKLDPKNPQAHQSLGNIYARLKNYDQAIELYKGSLNLLKPNDPQRAWVFLSLTSAYIEKGDRVKACENGEKAKDIAESNQTLKNDNRFQEILKEANKDCGPTNHIN